MNGPYKSHELTIFTMLIVSAHKTDSQVRADKRMDRKRGIKVCGKWLTIFLYCITGVRIPCTVSYNLFLNFQILRLTRSTLCSDTRTLSSKESVNRFNDRDGLRNSRNAVSTVNKYSKYRPSVHRPPIPLPVALQVPHEVFSWLCMIMTLVPFPFSLVPCPLSLVLCPLSFVLCPLSFV